MFVVEESGKITQDFLAPELSAISIQLNADSEEPFADSGGEVRD